MENDGPHGFMMLDIAFFWEKMNVETETAMEKIDGNYY
jgi:hypothetical protein